MAYPFKHFVNILFLLSQMKTFRQVALLVLQAVRIWRSIREARWQARLKAPKPEPIPWKPEELVRNVSRSDRDQYFADLGFDNDECPFHDPLDPFDDREQMECGCLVGSHSELMMGRDGKFFYLG